MITKVVDGKRIEIDDKELAEVKANIDPRVIGLRQQLINIEKENAINNLVEEKKAIINTMSEDELINAIKTGGLK